MNAIVLHGVSESDMEQLLKLAQKLNIKLKHLNDNELSILGISEENITSEWEQMHEDQKKGLQEALYQIAKGEGILSSDVITKYRKRYEG